MTTAAAGMIIVSVLGLFVLYKILVWIVPVHYDAFQSQVIHKAAFLIAVNGLQPDQIYTKDGEVRSALARKTDSREAELAVLHEKEKDYILRYLRERKLINKYGRTRKYLVPRIEYALCNYFLYERIRIYKDLEEDIRDLGVTPEQFFDLKKTVTHDIAGVYVICNTDQKMYYVGQAKKLYFRVWQHFTGHGNGDVYADYKYGNRFIIRFVPLSGSGYDDLDTLEKDMIRHYNAFTTGYNKTIGNSPAHYGY